MLGLLGRTEEAVRTLHQSVDLHREAGQHWLVPQPLIKLGSLYGRLGSYSEALSALHEAADIAKTADNSTPGLAYASYALAGVYRDNGQYDEAVRCAESAVEFTRRARIRLLEGLTLNRLGSIWLRIGDHEEARQRYRHAAAIAESTASGMLEAKAHNGMAEVHADMGAPAEAIRCYHAAMRVATRTGVRYEQARAHAGLAKAYRATGEHEPADRHEQQAGTIFRDLNLPVTN